jgi:pyruvate dehydrogenase E2 component (dihydrolipoamide acetyltransferase)
MSTDVRVPTTGNAGEDAVLVEWRVAQGATVSEGDILVVLETAKAEVEIEAPASGQILQLNFSEGDEVAEFALLAVIGEPGEAITGDGSTAPAAVSAESAAPADAVAPTTPATTTATALPAEPAAPTRAPATIVKASPRAKLIAHRNNLSLAGLPGSGPGGRVIIADVLAERDRLQRGQAPAVPSASQTVAATPVAAATPTTVAPTASAQLATVGAYESIPVRGARKVTATRMHESLQNTAQVTLTRYADAGALLGYAKRLKEATEAAGLPRIGVNDLLLFATAKAVAKHPEANATFDWNEIRRYSAVNLGFAVDTGQALLVPVIPNADSLSLGQLAAAARGSIDKARSGKLTMPEMDNGTFTVSNLGSLGVHWFTPVLNPPQACILGVGATQQFYPDGPQLLPLSLTFDHRCIDGAAAAVLLADIAASIQTVDVLSAL